VQVVDLADGPLDATVLDDARAIELRAERVGPDAVEAALTALRAHRPKALRLVSSLRSLPLALTELTTLHQLDVIDAELPGLPSSIGKLTRLRELRLQTFHLGSLPRNVGELTRLRTLYIDSHHLCGLPDSVRALQDLRELTLLLRRVAVPDWEHPAFHHARFEQPVETLFALLAQLPALSSLTLGEPCDIGHCQWVFDRLPAALAELKSLEHLVLAEVGPLAMPHGMVMPGLRRFLTCVASFDATPDQLRAMFPNAVINGVGFYTTGDAQGWLVVPHDPS
jgi:hypothetical protein